jgi:hypothetical protein
MSPGEAGGTGDGSLRPRRGGLLRCGLCRAKYDRYGARIVRHVTGADAYELAVRLSRRINDPPAIKKKGSFCSYIAATRVCG